MFLRAKDTFHLSDDTKQLVRQVSKDSNEPLTPAPGNRFAAKMLKHAKEQRRLVQEKWKKFDPQPPQLAKKCFYDVACDQWIEESVIVRIDQKPFGQGALRECFRMKEVNLETREILGDGAEGREEEDGMQTLASLHQESPKPKKVDMGMVIGGLQEMSNMTHGRLWVAKRALDGFANQHEHRHECRVDSMHQAMAKHCAELYNAEIQRRSRASAFGRQGARYIDFLLTHVLEIGDGNTYSAEAFVFGEYTKHNNNSGNTMGERRTPQSFSYFSWVNSQRRLMIVDIQGVDEMFTDPVVHFLPSHASGSFRKADSTVNLGIRGFALFLVNHRYNELDRLLDLPVFSLSRAEFRAHPPSFWPGEVADKAGTGQRSKSVAIDTLTEVDLRPNAWKFQDVSPAKKAAAQPEGFEAPRLPLELVEAACHMEIAVMYHEGRLSDRLPEQGCTRTELESAVFHLGEAARQGLPEALLAFARVVSDFDHQDFLPQLTSTEEHKLLCLVLLESAAAVGVLDAYGALARLILDGGYAEQCSTEYQRAAKHLIAFAEGAQQRAGMTPMVSCKSRPEAPKHEMSSKHGCLFGWENHGWQAHSAYARAAEIYEAESLRGKKDAWPRAQELWSLAAEVALEDPHFAKQAMFYTERAEADAPQAPTEERNRPAGADATKAELRLRLDDDLSQRFHSFAADFETPEAALDALLSGHAVRAESSRKEEVAEAPKPPVFDPPARAAAEVEEVDDDIWAMMG